MYPITTAIIIILLSKTGHYIEIVYSILINIVSLVPRLRPRNEATV